MHVEGIYSPAAIKVMLSIVHNSITMDIRFKSELFELITEPARLAGPDVHLHKLIDAHIKDIVGRLIGTIRHQLLRPDSLRQQDNCDKRQKQYVLHKKTPYWEIIPMLVVPPFTHYL